MNDDAAGPAYRTIGDVATLVGVPQHVLRFWETRFPDITPMKRGGNRRYYRPADVAVIQRIARLLHVEGYTIRGAQQLLASEAGVTPSPTMPTPEAGASVPAAAPRGIPPAALAAIRADLVSALAAARAL